MPKRSRAPAHATDPADSRRQLYTLSPKIQVRRSDAGAIEMDFGCCVLRMVGPVMASD